jgi:pimeloyl-ACP methyl ester carboxylesterase
MSAEVQQEMTEIFTVAIGNARIVGEHSGAGSPVIFLHAGVADRRMWQPQVADLGKRHHVIAYDRRGFGETRAADETFSHVEDLRAVLDHFGHSAASLVGCSQGGRIAIDFALAHPKRVRSLTLIAPAVSGAPDPEDISSEIETVVGKLDAAEDAGDWERVNALEAHLWLDGPTSREGRVSGALRELFLDMNGIALDMPELSKEIDPPSAYERVVDLSTPTLVIWGALDFPHVKSQAQYLVDTIPAAQGREIDGTAHLLNLEQPQVVNQLLRMHPGAV